MVVVVGRWGLPGWQRGAWPQGGARDQAGLDCWVPRKTPVQGM